jgi:uncharacterized membrane protein
VSSVYAEFALAALGAMVLPTTLSFSVLVLVVGDRPLRTGFWFYLGALGVTLAIGVLAAFVIGDVAASSTSTPKTWVAIVDVIAGVLALLYLLRASRRPADPERTARMIAQVSKVASSPAIAIVAAGATLANPGGFIPVALKDISQLNPSAGQFILGWVIFALVSLLPLEVALLMLVFARERTIRILEAARGWLERHLRTIAGVILLLLAVALLRNGIAGLTS